ncbi:MAG: hypothetical protein A2751_01230 [Candidatus Doudnabacteria bacterium RIFCSPHIGHO2_01_FULL_46_14]|uniref:Uncharacterized protein n=1 Tax=Candidatus Doudnabacteria bacterium RIFCSPHIGHO2_01_FULL_46_14 TaxID=1817824 RepID=A0A1F5NM77_9BACT|nr:MAG: hypothetical protein A2751_01230 [Candidatus Doudnabacteria bacterium RIFCSPHIGHO2_01_FULL_46_14]
MDDTRARSEFLRIKDNLIERIATGPRDLFEIEDRLIRLTDHLEKFAFLKIYRLAEDGEMALNILAEKLIELDAENRRKLIRQTLDGMRLEQ